jgi:hypothetical protein
MSLRVSYKIIRVTFMRICIQAFQFHDDPDVGSHLMRIRIQLSTLLRIRIQLFTYMRIRILHLVKVMRICDHWSTIIVTDIFPEYSLKNPAVNFV